MGQAVDTELWFLLNWFLTHLTFKALKTYEAEPNSTETGKLERNMRKNRYSDVLPCKYLMRWQNIF